MIILFRRTLKSVCTIKGTEWAKWKRKENLRTIGMGGIGKARYNIHLQLWKCTCFPPCSHSHCSKTIYFFLFLVHPHGPGLEKFLNEMDACIAMKHIYIIPGSKLKALNSEQSHLLQHLHGAQKYNSFNSMALIYWAMWHLLLIIKIKCGDDAWRFFFFLHVPIQRVDNRWQLGKLILDLIRDAKLLLGFE